MPSHDIEEIEDFVKVMTRTLVVEDGPMKAFVGFLGMSEDLKFAIDQAQPPIATTAIRLCAVRAFGGLDKLPKKIHKSLRAIGVV